MCIPPKRRAESDSQNCIRFWICTYNILSRWRSLSPHLNTNPPYISASLPNSQREQIHFSTVFDPPAWQALRPLELLVKHWRTSPTRPRVPGYVSLFPACFPATNEPEHVGLVFLQQYQILWWKRAIDVDDRYSRAAH